MKTQHKQILIVLEKGKPYSSDEIASMIGLKGSRTRELLKEMTDLGYIEATSATNGRRYIKKTNYCIMKIDKINQEKALSDVIRKKPDHCFINKIFSEPY